MAIISTESVDSDGDIIHQTPTERGKGWILDRFNNHPVTTWMHDIWTPSLSGPGTSAKVTTDPELGPMLVLDPAEFDPGDPFAQRIEGKLKRRSVSEWSVGFKGLLHDKRGEGIRGTEFFEQELIEVAVANRGSNLDTDTAVKRLLGREGLAA